MMPFRSASDALAAVCRPAGPVRVGAPDGLHRILADAVHAQDAVPGAPIALVEGWAVAAHETLGASPYAPVPAGIAPVRVACGDVLPQFADAVLPLAGVAEGPMGLEILAAAAPGENVRRRAGDLAPGEVILTAGERLQPRHVAVLALGGTGSVTVRIPRLRILSPQSDGAGPAPAGWLAAAAQREGAQSVVEHVDARDAQGLAARLAGQGTDFVVAAGCRRMRDAVLAAAAKSGTVVFDGLAVRPGEAMCGAVLARESPQTPLPVLFIPGRMECVLAAFLLLVAPCLRRIAAACDDAAECLPLARKIASAAGLSELALVRRIAGRDRKTMLWEPVATAEITLAAIARADAFLMVEAGREGYPAGAIVGAARLPC